MDKFSKKNLIFSLISVCAIVLIWWLLAVTKFSQPEIIPTPINTLKIIGQEMKSDTFFTAIFATLKTSLISFTVSFLLATILAILSHYMPFIKKLVSPFIALFRSMPTMALVLILMFVVGSKVLPVVVSFLVVFPLCCQNMFTAASEVDKNLITIAKVFKVSKFSQIKNIYLPAMLPYIFASIIGGFGLNIKVVISAEVMGLPSMSIGYMILHTSQAFKFPTTFAWLVIAVVLSFVCELILAFVGRLCMPYKYRDLEIIKGGFKRIFGKKSKTKIVDDIGVDGIGAGGIGVDGSGVDGIGADGGMIKDKDIDGGLTKNTGNLVKDIDGVSDVKIADLDSQKSEGDI